MPDELIDLGVWLRVEWLGQGTGGGEDDAICFVLFCFALIATIEIHNP